MRKENPIILPPGGARALDLSQQLIKQENEKALEGVKKHAEKLARVAEGIIKLLVEADCNWGDWGFIIEMMNDKSKGHFPKISIKELTKYGASTSGARKEVDGQGKESAGS